MDDKNGFNVTSIFYYISTNQTKQLMQDLMKELIESARGYSDTRIMNTLTQAHNFSKEKVEAAKVIALERGLLSEDGASGLTDKLDLIKDAKRMLEDQKSVDEILANFTLRGVPQEDAESALHEASKVADLNRKRVVEEEKSGSQWWWWIFIALFVIRMILRAVDN